MPKQAVVKVGTCVLSIVMISYAIQFADQSLDGEPELEPPETPAPVFAARALKSAIFGTPAPPVDDTLYDIESPSDKMAGAAAKSRLSTDVSPTKPQGILLTPGTATSRRKTVSFGTEVVDTTGLPAGRLRRSGKQEESTDILGNDRQSNRRTSSRASRKPSFTAQLETAREEALARTEKTISPFDLEPQRKQSLGSDIDSVAPKISRSKPSTTDQAHEDDLQVLQQSLISKDKFDGDVTMDLNEPHSQSGKYWKSQYHSYHDEAKVEMQNLLKSKHLIRSYAKTKDGEAVDLAEKLREEQRKVIIMESELSRLSAQIGRAGSHRTKNERPDLIKELADQTAQTLEYKAQVDNLRKTLLEVRSSKNLSNENQGALPAQSGQTHLDIQQELKEAKEQLHYMAAIRDEKDGMTQTISTLEAKTRRLEEDNTRLTADLRHANMRLDKQSERSEKRRQSFEERLQEKEAARKTLQKNYNDLKEQAKSQRRDAERLLKERHDQAVGLRKELASLQGAESTIRDLQQALSTKTSVHDQIVADLQEKIAELKGGNKQEPALTDLERTIKQQPAKPLAFEVSSQSRHSLIPVSTQSTARSSMTQTRSETPVGSPQPANPALLEIINHATIDTVPLKTFGPVHYTPLAKQFSDMTLESPKFELPSLEKSQPRNIDRSIPKLDHRPSPRPSRFNITSSPPRMAGNLRGGRRPLSMPSSHLPSLETSRARNPLPPERAAAARARLDQKNAEKKRRRALETDKENIPG